MTTGTAPNPENSGVVTFDVFSALIDSRRGGSDFFQHTATARGWQLTGPAVYDDWDRRNKQLHAQLGPWRPFADLAADALTAVYRTYQLAGDPAADCAHLLESMAGWPLWPDVTAAALTGVDRPLGLLSNIDDQLLARTAPLQLGVIDPTLVLTSQQLHAYKPHPAFYQRAADRLGPFVHVASSARDVRGALEAGIPCIRLARSRHPLDPAGPQPAVTIDRVAATATAVRSLHLSTSEPDDPR